ncbi:MAG TPA: hypothetical protein DGD08_04025 [Gemmatimonas aurantiaca]|uniref:Uncharacterized protein n=3 Tax=Gemmatimonas aurantiaca TaxID=173480 RepID=C1ADN5_GEMAT|nr:hypothetical protein GAU_3570 [Gemmatimonas aurantiaca T-27]HCT56362.1 hypothetical protein [Gemmatimonas aurantiaca]
MQPGVWKDWDAAAWGQALLRHYFVGHDARPVSRLSISPEELAKAAGASDGEAAPARDAFLTAVRCSAAAFRRHLSIASLERHAWNRHGPPPFLAYLFFTCFAAASLDADTADEGVFRERLRQLLGHHEGTSYALGDLSRLWEAFAAWLEGRHDAGEPYRTLSLPDRGRATLIGYSVRLAFPRREDRLKLRALLAASSAGPAPTVPEAFQAIARARDRFSTDFRHVFDRARAALASGRDVPELQALWSAILEAAALADRRDSGDVRIRYRLLAQEDELGRLEPFVVTAGVPSGTRHSAQFSPLDEPFDQFDHLVCATDGSTGLIANLLLMDALADKVPGLGASPISRAVRDGVLLFRQVDSATWELAVTRPTEGKVRALVQSRLSDAFMRLVSGPQRHPREARFESWCEVAAFDVTELAEARESTAPELASVRCLQRIEIGPQLQLVGGVRVDGGYLGLSGLLPEVYCAEAEHASMFRLSEESGKRRSTHIATLEPVGERPGVFGWSPGHGDLEGPYVFAGTRDGRVVAPREVLFHSRGLSHDYEYPTDPARWLVEDCSTDVAPAGLASEIFLATGIGSPTRLPAVDALALESVHVLRNRSVDDNNEHDRLVEALAAILMARKGIAESELIEILGKIVRQATGFAVWGIIRGWVEAGYLDCLTRRQWRGRVYFARRPQLVLIPDADLGSIRVVLHGLAPYRLRSAAREAFSRAGATPLSASSLSPYVPAPQAWRFTSVEHVNASIAEYRELGTVGMREPEELVGDFDSAVSDEAPLPPGYECQRVWDWAAGGFRRAHGSAAPDEVRIECHTRSNGPDRYTIVAGCRRRTTLSRSWALLDGFRLAGRRAFTPVGSVAIVRSGDDGPQVPLPIARVIGLRAGIVGGPAETATLGQHYANATDGPSARRWLLAWLSGSRADEQVARRFAWLRAATDARGLDTVPIPADLRRRLRGLHALPDALSIAERRIPRHLLAHVRRAVALTES